MALLDILKPYGVTDAKDLARVLKCHPEHARRFLNGRRRLSVKAAQKIKALTNGTYSLDYLLSMK